MGYVLCRHIKAEGLQCQSPSMTDGDFCYFHANFRSRNHAAKARRLTQRMARDARGRFCGADPTDPQTATLDLGVLEDTASVQVAVSTVINALAGNRIEMRRATALLYGLQLAAINCRNLSLSTEIPAPEKMLRETSRAAAGEAIAREGLRKGESWVFSSDNEDEEADDEDTEDNEEKKEEDEAAENDEVEPEDQEDSESDDQENALEPLAALSRLLEAVRAVEKTPLTPTESGFCLQAQSNEDFTSVATTIPNRMRILPTVRGRGRVP